MFFLAVSQSFARIHLLMCYITTGWWLGHPSEKYEFVNWDDDRNPIFMGKCQKWQPVTTNQTIIQFTTLRISSAASVLATQLADGTGSVTHPGLMLELPAIKMVDPTKATTVSMAVHQKLGGWWMVLSRNMGISMVISPPTWQPTWPIELPSSLCFPGCPKNRSAKTHTETVTSRCEGGNPVMDGPGKRICEKSGSFHGGFQLVMWLSQ